VRARVWLVLAALVACALPAPHQPELIWQSKLGQDDPRVGKIWDTAGHGFVERDELLHRARISDFVLLGEKHDNADHHWLQGNVIQYLARQGVPPTVAFEMLSDDDRRALEVWRKTAPEDVDALGADVDWDHSGWPPFKIYRPVFLAAISRQLPIEPANLSRAQLEALHHGGLAGMSPDERHRLALDAALPQQAHDELADEIREGHCGMVEGRAVDAMIDIQRVRDAALADALLRVGVPAVLIAGAGHVRKDRAVPFYLQARAPERHVLAVAFVEVGKQATEELPELERAYDFLWFTPRVDDLDPCQRFKEELDKMHKGATATSQP
jgi:uncharacterized iron-regulated protein